MKTSNSLLIRLSAEDYKFHHEEAIRLQAIAATITTAAAKARVLHQVQEHARIADKARSIPAELL